MTQVVIQPSFGPAAFRRHWVDTLDKTVPFGAFADVLTAAELTALSDLHTSGAAHFWGATAKHDARMGRLTPGDVVLLTGQKHVLAVGEVGHVFRNPAFARAIWRPDPGACNWDNVYSLLALMQLRIPYQAVWALPGFNQGDNFMGLRLLTPAKADAVLAGLGISTRTAGADLAVAAAG
jgi:hypothetical protein